MEDINKYLGMRIDHDANVVDVGYNYGISVALIKYDKRSFFDKNEYSIACDFYIDDNHELHYKKLQFFMSEKQAKQEFSKLVNNPKELNVKFVGIDDWSRPVYKDKKGHLYKDVNCGKGTLSLCTVYLNEFYGEPFIPIKEEIKVNIVKKFDKNERNER